MFNWTCHGLVLAVAKLPAHELRHISMGGAQMNAVINMCSLPLLRFREDKQRWGGLVCGTTRTGSELAAAWFIPVCFSALSFVFKADWHRNSDAATWSIWPLIPASVLRTAQMMPPPSSFFFTVPLNTPLSDYSPQSSSEFLIYISSHLFFVAINLCTVQADVAALERKHVDL